jgi:hypothetical protein
MSYLVEMYRPQAAGSASLDADACLMRVIAELVNEGSLITWIGSMSIPNDETAFYLFEAASAAVVGEAFKRAGLVAERIVEAIASDLNPEWRNRAPIFPGRDDR